jgi:hypothetical protein
MVFIGILCLICLFEILPAPPVLQGCPATRAGSGEEIDLPGWLWGLVAHAFRRRMKQNASSEKLATRSSARCSSGCIQPAAIGERLI